MTVTRTTAAALNKLVGRKIPLAVPADAKALAWANAPLKKAQQREAARRSLAAVRAHESRAALAILNGDHDESTVARFVALSKEAARLAAALN